jgi:glycosyltransferase involved in cell wall biosynthesis
MEDIALILPAFNESQTIVATIKEFREHLPEAFLVIVDNNSNDGTGDLARHTLIEIGASGVVLFEPRQGKGFALRRALKTVDATLYVMCDADQTYPASEAPNLIQILVDNDADMVVGDRHSSGAYESQNKRRLHSSGNHFVTLLVNSLFGADLVDIMSGYRAFTRKFARNYPILVSGFELETDMTLHALDKRMTIIEAPIEYKDRPIGSVSKLNTFSDGAKVLFTIFQLVRYYKPLLFFTAVFVLLSLAGLVAGSAPVLDYIRTGEVERFPLAILATGLEIAAVLSLAVGLVLDSIARNNKMLYERDL